MKNKRNELLVLKEMLKNPLGSNSEIARKINITSQGVGKIKEKLYSEGIIKSSEFYIDYTKFGIDLHQIALIKILPKASRDKQKYDLLVSRVLKPKNAIRSYSVPQTDVTHIVIYAFKNVKEYDEFFKKIQEDYGELVEIADTFVLSSESIIKSSSKDLFLAEVKDLLGSA